MKSYTHTKHFGGGGLEPPTGSTGESLPLRFHPLMIAFFMSDAFKDIALVSEMLGFKCRSIFGEEVWWPDDSWLGCMRRSGTD